ncbi:SufD family Fe-S cluster assembly protein [Xinfangfangia sp. D13-10-4-6]|uniref:SufB/SufD family protein n=1 Tax=Pseudogemmobacter hezensis TaxID=2737662 RepID=UPI00155476C2|nr:SufD family Fe-S cluster assembly protein [Pseudogemmobacter hezensis]NPD16928.1 SufD family Fe-S cluster assembly protein [Pseudogemmobacter hezensis]
MALPQVKQDALAARIAGLSLDAKGWAANARATAAERLAAQGLPVRRDEYWRYTDPSSLTKPEVSGAAPDLAPSFAALDAVKVVFTDGVFDAGASDDLAAAGIELLSQADADIHWAQGLYGQLEARGQNPVERPLATLNTAYAREGLLIRVTGKAAKPVSVIYNQKSASSDVILHYLVKLEAGAELTLLESGTPGARFNTVLEVDVASGAKFHHIRTQGPDAERRGVTHIFAHIADNALFKSFTLTAGGRLTRNEAILEITGDDSVAHVAGTVMGDGKDFLQDDTIFITHASERCESRQVYRKVLKNGATGVFQGKILVKQGAQKTDGYQMSQSLLLDEDAQFLAKPELEIYADDVKCSHGSTSGAIDETALFYLQSRGVPKRRAQALLVLAFLAGVLEEIEDEAIAAEVQARLEDWLHGLTD